MNDVKLQSENGFPLDENLRPIKIGNKNSSLELSQYENGSGARITGGLEVSGVGKPIVAEPLTTNNIKSRNLTIDDSGDINLTPAAGCDVNIPTDKGLTFGDDGEKIEGDGEDLTIASSRDLNLDTGRSIILDSAVGGFVMKGAGSTPEFSVADSAYAGMIIGYTTVGIDASDDSYTLTTTLTVPDDALNVSFIAPPSGVVEINVSIYCDMARRAIVLGLSDASATTGYSPIDFPNSNDTTNEHVVAFPPSSLGDHELNHRWVVTGLTAGDTYKWWLGTRCIFTGGVLKWGGNVTSKYGPFIMKATALPTAVTDFAVYG